ncbi:glycine cleavage system protein GcvH [Halalkalirubrum salinum]|uniref:glycine cleavage system protein GcvH n=1 Tax=Halalkalirubrum salinum TaxID=2563889 RepID=UPI0010C0B0A3|nr:glycine cleavage system protein GcvH [Halalkalirubrum salinum]
MSFDVPEDKRYLESHEWTSTDDETVRVGITDFAQDELGDVVFVELPSVGDTVTAGETFGVVESIKAVSDLYSPVTGEVVAVNEALFDEPELVNDDPFGDGWMLEVDADDPTGHDALLSPDAYAAQIE